jgi:hypothetical protein
MFIVTIVSLGLAFMASRAEAGFIADSVTEFSGVQGQDNWFYGYYAGTFAPSSFQQMATFRGGIWYVDPDPPSPFFWTQLNAFGGHPNGVITTTGRDPVEHWAVRRYISEVDGPVYLSGNIADLDGGGGNGIVGRIFVNGAEVYSAAINNGNSGGVDYLVSVDVAVGTVIDFAIDPRASDDRFDNSRFTATVTAVPEPTSFALAASGLIGLTVLGRPRRRGPGRHGG